MNFAGSSASAGNAVAQRKVARWVREDSRVVPIQERDPLLQVMVSEVQCFDEGCVPLETLVILVSRDARWVGKILLPISQVTQSMIATDLAIPSNWWLYSMLFLQRRSEPELSQGAVESAHNWLVENDRTEESSSSSSSSPSFLRSLEALCMRSGDDSRADREQAEMALLLLSKCVRMGLDAEERVGAMAIKRMPPAKQDEYQELEQDLNLVAPEISTLDGESAPVTVPSATTTTSAETSSTTAAPTGTVRPSVKFNRSAFDNTGLGQGTVPTPTARHNKNAGVRQRGCPCCDPDNIDNIVDSMFASQV